MKGELKIQRDPTRRKFRCPVWTVTLFAWEFPLDKFRKRVVAAIRKMDGFVGWCDPMVFFHEIVNGRVKSWCDYGSYKLRFCPECGRKIEQEGQYE